MTPDGNVQVETFVDQQPPPAPAVWVTATQASSFANETNHGRVPSAMRTRGSAKKDLDRADRLPQAAIHAALP